MIIRRWVGIILIAVGFLLGNYYGENYHEFPPHNEYSSYVYHIGFSNIESAEISLPYFTNANYDANEMYSCHFEFLQSQYEVISKNSTHLKIRFVNDLTNQTSYSIDDYRGGLCSAVEHTSYSQMIYSDNVLGSVSYDSPRCIGENSTAIHCDDILIGFYLEDILFFDGQLSENPLNGSIENITRYDDDYPAMISYFQVVMGSYTELERGDYFVHGYLYHNLDATNNSNIPGTMHGWPPYDEDLFYYDQGKRVYQMHQDDMLDQIYLLFMSNMVAIIITHWVVGSLLIIYPRKDGLIYSKLMSTSAIILGATKNGDERRQKLLEKINSRPGIHLSSLNRATGIKNGVLLHHLDCLEKSNQVKSESIDGVRTYYSSLHFASIEFDSRMIYSMFRDPYLEIISDLYFNPNSSLLDIQGRLNLSRFKSRRVIDRLEQNGVIQHIESGYVLSEIATNYAAHFYANSHEEFIVD